MRRPGAQWQRNGRSRRSLHPLLHRRSPKLVRSAGLQLRMTWSGCRQYVKDEQGHGLPTREGEDCDLKVIYEVFGRACYKPFDNVATALFSPKSTDCVLDVGCHIGTASAWFLEQGISGADVYEPTGRTRCRRAWARMPE